MAPEEKTLSDNPLGLLGGDNGDGPASKPKPRAKKKASKKVEEKKSKRPGPRQPSELKQQLVPSTDAERIAESRKAIDQPLPAGQKLFESPEGYVMTGEADKGHIYCRFTNRGEGGWINPRR